MPFTVWTVMKRGHGHVVLKPASYGRYEGSRGSERMQRWARASPDRIAVGEPDTRALRARIRSALTARPPVLLSHPRRLPQPGTGTRRLTIPESGRRMPHRSIDTRHSITTAESR